MKKFTRTMALLLIGGSTLVTSCVSEDISPEVENLRQAQVNYLNAKAAMEQAKADHEAAQAALVQLEIEYQNAIMQARVDSEIADMEAKMAAAKQAAAEAELQLQQAIDDLASQVNETAQEYLALYQSTMTEANNKLEDVASLQGDITRFKAFLDENGNPVDFEKFAAQLTLEIEQDQEQIATLEDNIARLEAIDLNTAEVEAELETVENEIAQKEADLAALNLEYQKANDLYNKLSIAYHGSSYGFYIEGAKDISDDIANFQDLVAYYEDQVSSDEATVASLEAQLAPFEAELDATGQGVPAAIDDAEGLLEAWILAEAEFNAIDINHDAGDTEYDDALLALDEAETAFIDYAGDYEAEHGITSPRTIADLFNDGIYYPIAGTTFGDALIPYMNVSNDPYYDSLKDDYAAALDDLNNHEMAVENYSSALSRAETRLAELLDATGVASVEELKTTLDDAFNTYYNLNSQYLAMNAEVDALYDTRNSLIGYLNGLPASIENTIAGMQNQIENLNQEIADNEAALADNVISQEEWEAKIVREEQKLERMTEDYEALVALANDYLEQFYAVVED